MAKGLQKKGIVPASALDLAPQGGLIGMSSQDVEGEPAQNGEVLGSMVAARAVAVLGKMHVEYPMEPVLDAPMATGDVEQSLGGDVFGQDIIAHERRIGALTPQASARSDASHRDSTWKAIDTRQAGIAHDRGGSRFAPIMAGRLDLPGCAALARSRKLLGNRGKQ